MKKLLFLLVALTTSIAFGQKLYGTISTSSNDSTTIQYIRSENCDTTILLKYKYYNFPSHDSTYLYSDIDSFKAINLGDKYEVIDEDNLVFLSLNIIGSGNSSNTQYYFNVYKYNIPSKNFEFISQSPLYTTGQYLNYSYHRINLFSRLPNGDYIFGINYGSNNSQFRFKLNSDLTVFTEAGTWPTWSSEEFFQIEILQFGTRWGLRTSQSYAYDSRFNVYNTVTEQPVNSMQSLSTSMNKIDENIAVNFRVLPDRIWVEKNNLSNFTKETIDTIKNTSPDWVKFNNGYPVAINYIGDGKFSVISNAGGSEAIGTISIYDMNTKTTTVVKSFTSMSEQMIGNIQNIKNFYNIDNILLSFNHIATVNENSTTIQDCFASSNLQVYNIKCPECLTHVPGGSVGVKESMEFSSISIHPNPTSSFITISNIPAEATISVLDYTGRIVLEKASKNTSEELDLSNCTPGMYIVQIASNNKLMQEKVIVK